LKLGAEQRWIFHPGRRRQVKEIDRTYGHLVRDSEDAIRARLDARGQRDGVEMASAEGDD
jgi:hypothetical protein